MLILKFFGLKVFSPFKLISAIIFLTTFRFYPTVINTRSTVPIRVLPSTKTRSFFVRMFRETFIQPFMQIHVLGDF